MGHIRPQPEIAMTPSYHAPVLVAQVIELLQIQPGKKYIDGTLGGGGHTWEILKRGGVVLGIDVDPEALDFVRQKSEIPASPEGRRNSKFEKNLRIVQGNFRNVEAIAKREGFERVDGILFDLGVSSHQLDTPARGFSYRFGSAPLDLRLNQQAGVSAGEYIQKASERELYEVFSTFGEEERAGTISSAIVRARSVTPVRSAGDLIRIVDTVGIPRPELTGVLSRIFQALRIAVNDELEALKEGIRGAQRLLVPGGRLAIISFHSLEDRVVKQMMRTESWEAVMKKPITSTQEEVERNNRARSAKLRVAEKL